MRTVGEKKDRILAIEDDEGVCRLLRHSLAREDYLVAIVHTGEEGLQVAIDDPPDLVLLDLELPGINGLEVCRKLKKNPRTRTLPVIILTGKGEETDVVNGLEIGADDYIVKPVSPKILNARVQAVLRRHVRIDTSPARSAVVNFGKLTIDTSSSSIKLSGKEIPLSPVEYNFILSLVCQVDNGKLRDIDPQFESTENPVSVIGREGMGLFAENRLDRLLPFFEEIVAAAEVDSPILFGFYALALFSFDPEKGLHYMLRSEEAYRLQSQPLGELVALSHLIFYHVIYDGNARMANRYLERAEILSKAFFDGLSVFSRIAVAQNLAIGRAFLLNDFEGANVYLEIAEALAEDRGLVNMVVTNRMIALAESFVTGNQDRAADGLEELYRFVNHPQVSRLNKNVIKSLQLRYLATAGDFSSLKLYEEAALEESGQQSGQATLAATELLLCRFDRLLFEQRYQEGLAFCQELLGRDDIRKNDLVRPILSGGRALLTAVSGDMEAAQKAMASCQKESGQMTHRIVLAKLYCARAFAAVGNSEEAKLLLEGLAAVVSENHLSRLTPQLRAQLLLLDSPLADDTIGALLSDMRRAGVWYMRTLLADDYHHLYRLAVESGEEVDYAREMVQRRLLLDYDEDGEAYPRLRIKTLGGVRLFLGEEQVARSDDFSRSQRECLALLAAMSDCRISQEEVQLVFWPDKSPEKARSTLDTMLSRLRKTLKEKLHPYPVKRYLKLQKGVLSLEHAEVDADRVAKALARAREFIRRRRLWQADVAFSGALSLWQGPFMPGACSADQSAAFADQIQSLCIDAVLEWEPILHDSGQTPRAIAILSHALAMDRGNEELMRALYRCHMRHGNILRANELLKQFEKDLREEGHSASEAAMVIVSFKASE